MSPVDTRVEIRELGGGGLTLSGYAAVTERPYDMGWYEETIARGAFRRSLSNNPGPDVSLLVNHGQAGSGLPIARTTAGSLRLVEDEVGLRVGADLDPEDPEVQSLHRKMLRGDLDGQMSFAFRIAEQKWNEDRNKRRVIVADIHRGDCSVVNYAANDATFSSIRSLRDTGAPSLEIRCRRADALGKRFVGPGFPFGGAGAVALGAPPDLTPKRAQQRLDLLRLDTGQSLPVRPATRRARKALIDARAASTRHAERLELLRAMKRR